MNILETITPKSDQISADELLGGPITITVARVGGNEASAEQPVNVYYEKDLRKPFRPCKLMRRVMVAAWAPDTAAYVGGSMVLYRNPDVKFGGIKIGVIRIRAMSHLDADFVMALTETRGQKKPFKVTRLAGSPQRQAEVEGVNPNLLADARAAAERGSEPLRIFWDGLEVRYKNELKAVLAGLKARAAEVDAARAAPQERDPGDDTEEERDAFGLPPVREREPGEDDE